MTRIEEVRWAEIEPFPRYPVLITGAGHGTGLEVAKLLSKRGFTVYVGTRSKEHYGKIEGEMAAQGTLPKPFIADFSKSELGVIEAYQTAGIQPGEPLHYFPFAAAGFEQLKADREIRKILVDVIRMNKQGTLQTDFLLDATMKIRSIVIEEKIRRLANQVNRDAPELLGNLLFWNGNLTKDSVIATLSSSISDTVDPAESTNFKGPWIYYPIAKTKAQGVLKLQALAKTSTASFIDFVAPEIEGTEVAELIDKLTSAVSPFADEPIKIPKVTMQQVAESMYMELTRPEQGKMRKIYITDSGTICSRPPGWEKPMLPYL